MRPGREPRKSILPNGHTHQFLDVKRNCTFTYNISPCPIIACIRLQNPAAAHQPCKHRRVLSGNANPKTASPCGSISPVIAAAAKSPLGSMRTDMTDTVDKGRHETDIMPIKQSIEYRDIQTNLHSQWSRYIPMPDHRSQPNVHIEYVQGPQTQFLLGAAEF
jgi:hypothetical protein